MKSVLAKVFPKQDIRNMTLVDFLDQVNCKHDIVRLANEQFFNIEKQLAVIENICSIKPLLSSSKEELASILGEVQITTISNEGIVNILKDAFLKLKNFFMKLWDMIVAFFKRVFDVNVRSRNTLNMMITEFYRSRSDIVDERIKVLSVYILGNDKFNQIRPILERLADDTVNASKAVSSAEAAQFCGALKELGYAVINDVINTTKMVKQISPESKRFQQLGWTTDSFIVATQQVVNLCSRSEQANIVKNQLDSELKAGMREVDRLNSIERANEAFALQQRLNDLSKRSSYVFKSAVILQSYVEQLCIQFTDTWNNINSLSIG